MTTVPATTPEQSDCQHNGVCSQGDTTACGTLFTSAFAKGTMGGMQSELWARHTHSRLNWQYTMDVYGLHAPMNAWAMPPARKLDCSQPTTNIARGLLIAAKLVARRQQTATRSVAPRLLSAARVVAMALARLHNTVCKGVTNVNKS